MNGDRQPRLKASANKVRQASLARRVVGDERVNHAERDSRRASVSSASEQSSSDADASVDQLSLIDALQLDQSELRSTALPRHVRRRRRGKEKQPTGKVLTSNALLSGTFASREGVTDEHVVALLKIVQVRFATFFSAIFSLSVHCV